MSGAIARSPERGSIVDLFAGAGGWEEGLGLLGLSALGVETEAAACETARLAGHDRLQADVAALSPEGFGRVWGLIASPPCQAYSTAGKGLGRLDKPLVVRCAKELAAGADTRRQRRAECRDQRSLLSVEPLRYALALAPAWIALEQVPPVLELWNVFASILRDRGYQTATGVLSAERYGVPQTRRRAFLIASLDGPVSLPAATHRSYSPRRKERPADELGLAPWVSMAEALGWGMTARPGLTIVAGNKDGGSQSRACVARQRKSGAWVERVAEATRRGTLTGHCRGGRALNGGRLPAGVGAARGGWAWRNGNQANATVRGPHTPAPTIHFGHGPSHVAWVPKGLDRRQAGALERDLLLPAPTMLASGLAKGVPVWAGQRPATTIACDYRVCSPGAKRNGSRPNAPGRSQGAVRVTVEQAAVLQGFRPDYPWSGSKTRRFEQVGNAVPPPLARAVVAAALRLGGS